MSEETFKRLGIWRRCKKYFNPSNHLVIYITYFRLKIEYNSLIWAGASKSILKFLAAYRNGRRCSLMTVEYSTPLTHWNTGAMCHMFTYSIAATRECILPSLGAMFPKNMFSYAAYVFAPEHIHLYSTGLSSGPCISKKIHSLAVLSGKRKLYETI